MFKRNEGVIDRTLRVVLAIVLLLVGLFWLGGLQSNLPGLIVAGVGLLPLITGLTGFCPLYVLFGISTLEKEKELMLRCRSMMAGFRRESAGSGDPTAGQMRGPSPHSIGEPRNEKGKTAQMMHGCKHANVLAIEIRAVVWRPSLRNSGIHYW